MVSMSYLKLNNFVFQHIFQWEIQHCFLTVVNFRHEEITLLMSGSSQYSSSDKIFPHPEPPPAYPWLLEQKQHASFNLKKKEQNFGNLGPSQPNQPDRSKPCCVTRTQQVHLLSPSPGSVYILLAAGSGSVWLGSALTGNYQTIHILNYFDISSVESCRFPENMTCLWALGPVAPPEE